LVADFYENFESIFHLYLNIFYDARIDQQFIGHKAINYNKINNGKNKWETIKLRVNENE
jgi:hypothetical protein